MSYQIISVFSEAVPAIELVNNLKKDNGKSTDALVGILILLWIVYVLYETLPEYNKELIC